MDNGKKGHKLCSTPYTNDRKRDKLGYMRISVACAPCRQRKMRCTLKEGDLQKRCRNCIKRRKECVFRPVDQHNTAASGTQSSKIGAASVTSVQDTYSPLEPTSARLFEDVDYQGESFPQHPPNMFTAFPSLPCGSGSALPSQGVIVSGTFTPGVSGSKTDKSRAFDSVQTSVQRLVPCVQLDDLMSSSQCSRDLVDAYSHSYWMSDPLATFSKRAPSSTANADIPPSVHYELVTSWMSTSRGVGGQFLNSPTPVLPAQIYNPQNSLDRCPPLQLVEEYIALLRKLLAIGWPEDMVLGPTRMDADWLFADTFPWTSFKTMSRWIAEIISTFEVIGVPEKLGLMVLYCRYFKWLITRSAYDYHQVPRWMRPTTTQTSVKHKMWIDLIPWPEARDLIIKQPYEIDDIYGAVSEVSGYLSLAWPLGPADLIDVDPDAETTHPSPLLEQYALDLQNWALQPGAASHYPFLAGFVRVADA